MEKKTPTRDIYPVTTKNIKGISEDLIRAFGAEVPFAKFSIGGGFYVWSDNRCNWLQMIAASESEQKVIRDAYYEFKKRFTPLLGEQNAEILFTIPDESYIYYCRVGGETKFLITGWGFMKPTKHTGGPDIIDVKDIHSTSWSLCYDGTPLPNYEFGIKAGNDVKRKITPNDGVFKLEKCDVGSSYTIVDLKSGKEFNVMVTSENRHYDFDITTRCKLVLSATEGATPIVGECINVAYNEKAYSATTNQEGKAEIALPYFENTIIEATLRGESKCDIIQLAGNEIAFNFQSEVAPEITTTVEVEVYKDSMPSPNEFVTVSYSGRVFNGITDLNGKYSCVVKIVEGAVCEVSVGDYGNKSRELTQTPYNLFRFDKLSEIVDDKTLITPYIFIKGEEGYIGSKYPIRVEYNGISTQYVSDENGIVQLPKMEAGAEMVVYDVLHDDNIERYTLDAETLEYIFHIPNKPVKQDIKVMFRDYYDRPVKCDSVRFYQEETLIEHTTTLDEEGCAYFDYDTFLYDRELTATINGWERTYKPIAFTIEEGEYAYLIQELKPKTNWQVILLQIFALLAAIALVGAIWILFEPLCREIFDLIYN